MPEFFQDLALDQVVESVLRGREAYNLAPFFYRPLQSTDAVAYRQEVMRDVGQPAVQAAVTAFAIPQRSVGFWLDRLLHYHVAFEQPTTRFDNERVIAFRDPDGLMLELVSHPDIDDTPVEVTGRTVPGDHAIRRLYAITLWEEGHTRTARLLTGHLGFQPAREQGSIYRYVGGESIVDLRIVPGLWDGVPGAGTIHHVAFRAGTDEIQMAAHDALAVLGYNITPQLDRDYFRSIYFREPGGVLFEIATDAPGFAVDEPPDQLGQALRLPAWLEPRRFEIEALLPNIHLPIPLPGPNA